MICLCCLAAFAALQWQAPSNIPVSESCLDLLRHILVPDPTERYSIADIFAHPWFQENLPVEVRFQGFALTYVLNAKSTCSTQHRATA
jgi:serine/threonine protein kinase